MGASGAQAGALRAELSERMDDPDFDDDVANRPVGEIITDIVRDFGIAAQCGKGVWKRRTPSAIRVLNDRAAQPGRTRTPAPPDTLPS